MEKVNVQLSPEFRTQTVKAVTAIGLFVFTYFVLFLLALGLTALCIMGGILLISIKVAIITIGLGLGLASLGVLILIFLVKFLFKSHKTDRSHLLEITQADEPLLFAMIEDIVAKAGTSFPKKVYLSYDVNAAVFYDSNFWSMFFPVKKNLQIGIGLVNSVTQAELKAILAHEFGHFSQRSMKVGSYVYQVNQVLINMLYENDSFDQLAAKWANITGYFHIFVVVAVKIIKGIQWILRKMYELVNREYLGLSREMEFHADEVAAHITGFQPLKTSLLRLSFANYALDSVFDFYNGKVSENLGTQNLFADYQMAMNILAKENGLDLENSLPKVTEVELSRYNKSKLVIKDQWASHPSTEDRVARLEKSGITVEGLSSEPAGALFLKIADYHKTFTEQLFSTVNYQGEPTQLLADQFSEAFEKDLVRNSFPKIFNGYYDNKNPVFFAPEETSSGFEEMSDLFSDEKEDWIYTAQALENDIRTLNQIHSGMLKVKSFDYDGIKYKPKQSIGLAKKLRQEADALNAEIRENDRAILGYFYGVERMKESKLADYLQTYFSYDNFYAEQIKVYDEISQGLVFVNQSTPFDVIRLNFLNLKPLELTLKTGIRAILEDPAFANELDTDMKANFELYINHDWVYFGNEKYFDEKLAYLFQAKEDFGRLLSRGYFLRKKELLEYWAGLVKLDLESLPNGSPGSYEVDSQN
ncbi:M48 family metalloprotease [Algoriphagus aestuariicola]|uniref:M48 family metalloprotease n=1 Tax=Algoriphagus aestuariicola TaxID=1852016 RepID=A0ABS3BY08_9BACT|nr:M48 family metallopeptidase [Algoriphagus aestuariicola]MBN7802604.1 M48 family metalloprotease [Algoriphagus aestuariicola]